MWYAAVKCIQPTETPQVIVPPYQYIWHVAQCDSTYCHTRDNTLCGTPVRTWPSTPYPLIYQLQHWPHNPSDDFPDLVCRTCEQKMMTIALSGEM